jgi:hypothetical protein
MIKQRIVSVVQTAFMLKIIFSKIHRFVSSVIQHVFNALDLMLEIADNVLADFNWEKLNTIIIVLNVYTPLNLNPIHL